MRENSKTLEDKLGQITETYAAHSRGWDQEVEQDLERGRANALMVSLHS